MLPHSDYRRDRHAALADIPDAIAQANVLICCQHLSPPSHRPLTWRVASVQVYPARHRAPTLFTECVLHKTGDDLADDGEALQVDPLVGAVPTGALRLEDQR